MKYLSVIVAALMASQAFAAISPEQITGSEDTSVKQEAPEEPAKDAKLEARCMAAEKAKISGEDMKRPLSDEEEKACKKLSEVPMAPIKKVEEGEAQETPDSPKRVASLNVQNDGVPASSDGTVERLGYFAETPQPTSAVLKGGVNEEKKNKFTQPKKEYSMIKKTPVPAKKPVPKNTPAAQNTASTTNSGLTKPQETFFPVGVKEATGGFGRISSEFGMRKHPKSGIYKMHAGIDIAAPAGTPVRSMAPGVVIFSGWKGGYGFTVDVAHGNGTITRYAHLHARVARPMRGKQVRTGDLLGGVGSTGVSTGNHLHYEVRVNGRPVNPRTNGAQVIASLRNGTSMPNLNTNLMAFSTGNTGSRSGNGSGGQVRSGWPAPVAQWQPVAQGNSFGNVNAGLMGYGGGGAGGSTGLAMQPVGGQSNLQTGASVPVVMTGGTQVGVMPLATLQPLTPAQVTAAVQVQPSDDSVKLACDPGSVLQGYDKLQLGCVVL